MARETEWLDLMVINQAEREVLVVLTEAGSEEFGFYSFGAIVDVGVRLDRRAIRRACRSLARKGLAKYGRGLWTEDGGPAGAGYCATKAGCKLIEECERLAKGLI